MTNAIVKAQDMSLETLGQVMVKSGFFSDTRDAAQAIVKILAGQELGFGPIASMQGVYIVKGKTSLSANLVGAAIKRSGRYDYRIIKLDGNENPYGCSPKVKKALSEYPYYHIYPDSEQHELRQALQIQEAQAVGQGGRMSVRSAAGDHEAPFAEAGHVGVVGRGPQADGLDGLHHGPVALACHKRRGGLDHRVAAGGQPLVQQGVERVGVELAQVEVGGVGKVHHDHIEHVPDLIEPFERVGVDHGDFR